MIATPDSDTIHVAIVAAHAVVRAGLTVLLDNSSNLVVIGAAASPADAAALIEKQPHVTVVDPDSQEVTLRAVAELTTAGAQRIIVLTAQGDEKMHQRAMALGAAGVVMKNDPVEMLVRAIQKVHAGEMWLDRIKAANLLNSILRQRDPEDAKILTLTKREREVIDLVGQGLKNVAIGERLFITEATVRNHLTSILAKLGLSDRFELAVYSFRHGLLETDASEGFRFNSFPASDSRVPARRAGRA